MKYISTGLVFIVAVVAMFALGGCGFSGGAKSDYRPARSMIAVSEPATSGYCTAQKVRLVNGAVYLEC